MVSLHLLAITWWRFNAKLTEVTDAINGVTINGSIREIRTAVSSLTFTNTQPILIGQYQCTASNLLGVACANATLTVNGELKRLHDSKQSNYVYLFCLIFSVSQMYLGLFCHLKTPHLLLMNLLTAISHAQLLVYQLLPFPFPYC